MSPDGRYVANVVQLDCGATEHDTVVELRLNRSLLTHQSDIFVTTGLWKLSIVWRGNRQLSITAPNCDSDNAQVRNWRDVAVRCERSEAAERDSWR